MCVVAGHRFHQLVHAPVHVGLDSLQGLTAEGGGLRVKPDSFGKVGEVLSQKYDEKGHGDVAHTLHIATGRVPIVPDK